MKTSSFSFDLPEELIAQYPADKRGNSRLLVLDRSTSRIDHRTVADFPSIVPENTLIVFNNSRVRKARVYGLSDTGSEVEFLFIRPLLSPDRNDPDWTRWTVMTSKARKQKPGRSYAFADGTEGRISGADGQYRTLELNSPIDDSWLDINGHMPLPPYIKRGDEFSDSERYQTVFSRVTGSVAAPTAGLHFTGEILDRINERGIETASVTLHVGLGTFLPVRTEQVEEHKMHSEEYEISEETAERINRAAAAGKKIIAVGTTSVRTLESEAAATGCARVRPGKRSTDIFIYPGCKFRLVDHMFTNFHTPESSLLMLVSAFAGKELIDTAYSEAVKERYRFFSYGDAMFII